MSDDEELLGFYGEQLEFIRCENTRLRRENGFLLCFVISLVLWVVTG